MRATVMGLVLLGLVGCNTLEPNAGQHAVDLAKAKYAQDTTFVTFEMKGVTEIKGTNIQIVARSYKPPISIIPEPSIVDRICDAAKWLGGFWIGGEVLKSVSAKTVVDPTIVKPEVITVPSQ